MFDETLDLEGLLGHYELMRDQLQVKLGVLENGDMNFPGKLMHHEQVYYAKRGLYHVSIELYDIKKLIENG